MKKIDWDKPLSEEDILWLRTTGILGIEDRITEHQARFDQEVPEADVPPDTATKSAQDPTATQGEPTGGGVVTLVDPTGGGSDVDEDDDDYEDRTKSQLEYEVAARNALPDTSEVTVVGTGANGGIRKEDLIKGLRLWDQENPEEA